MHVCEFVKSIWVLEKHGNVFHVFWCLLGRLFAPETYKTRLPPEVRQKDSVVML